MKNHSPAYVWFIVLMALICILGLVLLFYGSAQGPRMLWPFPGNMFLGGYAHG